MTTPDLIILEGPDCSGKSTLAIELCHYLKAHYIHSSYTPGMNVMEYHTNRVDEALEYLQDGPVVIDRLYPSEMVYGRFFRGNIYDEPSTDEHPWGTKYLKHHNRLEAANAVHIYCIPSKLTEAIERYATNIDKDHPYTISEWEEIYMLYNLLYVHVETTHPNTRVLHYDIDTDGKDINKFIRTLNQ